MAFHTELHLKPYEYDLWQLTQPLIYEHPSGWIEVSEGFVTDLASIPRIFRPLFPVHGPHTRAAVVHDWLYVHRGVPGKKSARAEADRIFLDAMKELGVGWFKRNTMYAAVRAGGWLAWKT